MAAVSGLQAFRNSDLQRCVRGPPRPVQFSTSAETPRAREVRRFMTKNSDDRRNSGRKGRRRPVRKRRKVEGNLMKKLLIGAAVGALLLPAAPALAQHFADDGHDHACVDEACTVFDLFQAPAA